MRLPVTEAHERVHENSFFELVGDLPVEVTFAITEEDCRKLLELLARERLSLFYIIYIKSPCEFGHIGDE